MPWSKDVPAILVSWLPGQEAGNALADVLFGIVNPYGRLPVTIPNKENEIQFTEEQYPGVGTPPEAAYTEELLIGYRWYNANNVKPLFPFGHGISYTTWGYSNLHLKLYPGNPSEGFKSPLSSSPIIAEASLSIANIGGRAGSEIVQLYITYPSEAKEPPKQLRAFAKVDARPNFTKSVTLTLTKRDISIWNADVHAWEIVPGDYKIAIGASSEDIQLQTSFKWNG